MAITGKLVADFSSFQDAVTKAEVSLRSFEGNAGKVQTSLNRMTDSFSGRQVITEATLMTEAITKAGGASTLTAREMATVNARLSEAIEKSKALGIEAPAAMQKLHLETTKAAESAKGLPSSINAIAPANQSLLASIAPLAGAFGIAFSATAIVGFGKEILNNADAMVKLSDKTGIAIEPIQRLKFAAEQSGNTFEQVASAIGQMQNRIGSKNDGALGALSALGLSFQQLQGLSPDQQFIAIAREIAKVEDPMERTRLAMQLFGRTGAELLPTIISDIEALGDSAPVMSEKATKALDMVGDAFSHLASSAKNFAGEVAGSVVDGFTRWSQAAAALAEGKFRDIPLIMADVVTEAPRVKAVMDALIPSAGGVALSWEEMDRVGKELTETARVSIREHEGLKRVQDALFGRDLIDRATALTTAVGDVSNVTQLTKEKKEELQKAVIAALDAYKRLGEEAPPELLKLAEAAKPAILTSEQLTAVINKLHTKELPPFTGLLGEVVRYLPGLAKETKEAALAASAYGDKITAVKDEVSFLTVVQREQIAAGQQLGISHADLAKAVGLSEVALRFYLATLQGVRAETSANVRETLSWSEAMEQVRQGKGTMTGTVMAGGMADRARIEQLFAEGKYSGPIKNYTTDAWGKVVGGQIDWDAITGGGLPKRALGGPVSAGTAYMVGEAGPEMFLPMSSGTILPNDDMRAKAMPEASWQKVKEAAERLKTAMASIDTERNRLMNRALTDEEQARKKTLDAEAAMLQQGLALKSQAETVYVELARLSGRTLTEDEKARYGELDTLWNQHRDALMAGYELIRAAGIGAFGDILTVAKAVGEPHPPTLGKGVGGPLTPALGKGVGPPLIGVPGTPIDPGGLALPMPTAKAAMPALTWEQEQYDWMLANQQRLLAGNRTTPMTGGVVKVIPRTGTPIDPGGVGKGIPGTPIDLGGVGIPTSLAKGVLSLGAAPSVVTIQNLNVNAGLSAGPEVAQAVKAALQNDLFSQGMKMPLLA